MAREILFPTHLDALIVAPGTVGPRPANVDADVFAPDLPPLTPGIHLHWALPDALTTGKAVPGGAAVDLPAVPDRWLVVRFGPPTSGTTPRSTRAWIVGAADAPVPLSAWTPVAPTATNLRTTVLGELPRGRAPVGDGTREPTAADCAYYPRARRFRFHDELGGVDKGHVSYAVVGWYADREHDPLDVSAAVQEAWLRERRCVLEEGAAPELKIVLVSPVPAGAAPATSAGFGQPRSLGSLAAGFTRLGTSTRIGTAAAASVLQPIRDALAAAGVTIGPKRTGDRLVCHGALTDLPWNLPPPSLTPEPTPGVRLYPSLREAAERYFADRAEDAFAHDASRAAIAALFGGTPAHSASFLEAAWNAHAAGFVAHLGEDASAPRYHAADAPVVLAEGLPRSPRHGEDADLDPERGPDRPGQVRLRTTTVTGLRVVVAGVEHRVVASGLAEPVAAAGLPAMTDELLDEVMLLDRVNQGAIAAKLRAQGVVDGDARSAAAAVAAAWWQAADPAHAAAARAYLLGRPPMPFSVKSHWPTALPLYLEVEGTVRVDGEGVSRLPDDWRLGQIDLERQPQSTPTLGPPRPFKVRRVLTPVVARMLASVTGDDALRAARLLAATLPEVDLALGGTAIRGGTMEITRARAIDTFGPSYPLLGPGAVQSSASLELTPRLGGWARLHARLLAASSSALDAGDDRPAVCGFVLPDRVDHALEIFDQRGGRVGQLRHRGQGGAASMVWEPDPARAVVHPERGAHEPERVLDDGEPDRVLLAIVRGLLAAQARDGVVGGDTALSALIGALDALQATAARTTHGDDVGPLLGRPLAVVRMATWLDRVAPTAGNPVAGARADTSLVVPLAFGAVTRSDDGTFGAFTDGDYSHFRPVDGDAIAPQTTELATAATLHPYLLRSPVVTQDGQRRVSTLLVDPRLAIHVRTGVLPAKRIALTTPMYQPALSSLAPTVRVGPVLLPPSRPWLPTPYLPGSTWRWLHVAPTTPGQAVGAPVAVELVPPGAGAALTEDVVVAQDGWLRRVPLDKP